jgi:hypothetical protein
MTSELTQAEATSLAAVGVLIAALLAAAVALFNESKRRRDTRHADDLKELRTWTAEVFGFLFVLQHEMEWITWHARRVGEVTPESIKAYEAGIHAAYPKALGAMAVVASIDADLYQDLKIQADSLYDLESRVALAAISVPRGEANARLAPLYDEAVAFYTILPLELAKAMRNARISRIRKPR